MDKVHLVKDLLARQRYNNKLAIKQNDKSISYSSWFESAMYVKTCIENVAEASKKCVGIFLPNSIDYAVAYFSILFSNNVIVPVDVRAKKPEIISTINYCEINFIITNEYYKNDILKILDECEHKIYLYIIDRDELFTNNKKCCLEIKFENSVLDNDVIILLHTSGTTSNPKRVMLTNDNLISNIESNIASLNLSEDDKVLISLPMYFGYCNTAQFLTHVYLGALIVISKQPFFTNEFFRTVESEGITNFTGVPYMLLKLLSFSNKGNYNYSSLKYLCFGGSKMPTEKLRDLILKYPSISFVHTYGQTECSPRVTALLPESALLKIGSVGKPIPNVKIKIVDEKGIALDYNTVGEIVVQGKNIMKGYFKQPKITKKTIINSWLHTGDLGYLDEEGFLYLTGRIKNIIISGGVNIYPEEIEEVLLAHEGVNDVYVLGEEHNLLGEVPIAKIVLKYPVTVHELEQYCKKRLAVYKVPIRFEFVDFLEKTYNGKIRRH